MTAVDLGDDAVVSQVHPRSFQDSDAAFADVVASAWVLSSHDVPRLLDRVGPRHACAAPPPLGEALLHTHDAASRSALLHPGQALIARTRQRPSRRIHHERALLATLPRERARKDLAR